MKYAKVLENFIDKDFLKDIVSELVDEAWIKSTDADALRLFTDNYKIMVDDYEQLQEVKNLYPDFSDYLKILKMDSNGTWPVSIAPGDTSSSVCIPIENPLLSIAFFDGCEEVEDGIEDYIGNQYGYWQNTFWSTYYTGGEKVHTHVLSDTSLLDASIPKQFVNSSDNLSIMILWKYNGPFKDFE